MFYGCQNNFLVKISDAVSLGVFAELVVYSLCGYNNLKGNLSETLPGSVDI